MNIGGWHILAGLFFLGCCIVLTIIYVYGVYVLYVAFRKIIFGFKHYNAEQRWIAGEGSCPEGFMSPPQVSYLNKRFFIKTSFMIIILLVTIYFQERKIWMGNDNTYYQAKEYYVVGQVVFAHRKIFGYGLHPENILMRPYTALQKKIYNCGVKYLPQNDGERFVWENYWFLHLYTRKMLRPYGVGVKKYEPSMVELLDQCWESMEGMATHDIKDPQMKRDYYLGYPSLVSYYSLYQGHYTGKFMNAGTARRKTEYLIERNYKTLLWLDQLESAWEQTGLIHEIKTKYPFVVACRQGTILDLLQDLALTIVSKGKFSCDHPLIKRLHTEYVNAMSDDPDKNYFLLYSKRNSRQAKLLYQPSVYSASGSSANYLLSHICGKEMPVEKFNVVSRRDPLSCKFYENNRVERVFKEELKPLLKEKKHE